MTTRLGALRADYLSGLRSYLEDESESGLAYSYELGRRAMMERLGLLDVVALHRAALETLVLSAAHSDQPRLIEASAAYFNELLAPFELSI